MPSSNELDNLRVVLVESRNPLNIGAAARAMSNFGCSQLRLVAPFDMAFREARSAVGASAIMKRAAVFPDVSAAIFDCSVVVGTTAVRHRELHHPLQLLSEAGAQIRAELARTPVALLFGSEKFGLSTEDLSHCHRLLRIPTREQHLSMNLGQAVAVCLYEIARSSSHPATVRERAAATMLEVDRITGVLTECLHVSGYVKQRTTRSTEEKIRRLVRRLRLDSADAELLLGMLRKVQWKLQSGTEPRKK